MRRAIGLVALGMALAAPAVAAPPRDTREMQAREAYAAGRYQQALDLFVKLYAEKLHPNYLRNIGRCYQNLGDADKAIGSFREYLRKARNISAAERKEIDGYIAEMEELKAKKSAPPPKPVVEATPTPTPTPTPPPPPPPVMEPAPPPPPQLTTPTVTETAPPPEAATPVY